MVGKKQKLEEDFTQWVNQSEERKAVYGEALQDIQKASEGRKELQNASQYLMEA